MELSWELVAFAIFSVFTLGGGLLVVLQRNLFHAALSLMLSLFGVAGLFVLLVAPFLAVVQVLVYIGAIAILILFSIMLTRRVMGLQEAWNSQWLGAAVVAGLIFVLLVLVLTPFADDVLGGDAAEISANFVEDPVADVEYVTVQELGIAFGTRTHFVLPFEVASLLLTSVLIGSIVIAREDEA